jgi:hypothetical protein
MKEEDLVKQMLGARVKFYSRITYVLLGIWSLSVIALAGTIYLPTNTEPEVLTVLIGLVSGLSTALLGIVTQGVAAARRLRSDEEIAKQVEELEAKRITGKTVKFDIEQHEEQKPDEQDDKTKTG